MKRILITGGAGFIGTHLSKKLSDQGHAVTVLDLTPPERALPRVTYIQGDVRLVAGLKPLIQKTDAVFHLAAIVSVAECQIDPVGSFETNTASTLRILDLIRSENEDLPQDKKIRIIFSSSSAVYGDQGAARAIAESTPLFDPLSFYGSQKLTSEQLIRLYAGTYGVPAVVFRFFNVYGPGQKVTSPYSGVISVFFKALREGQVMVLNAGGRQTRDFVSVHDIVSASCLALDSENPRVISGAPLNLGSGVTITIRALAESLFKIAGEEPRMRDAPGRPGDILHSCADIARAERELGFRPQVTLEAGLKELAREVGALAP
jgi:UDP-glucose 4-epimerase